jgi:16S rRNA (cytidine1402-2'-O)-methyltransferase
VGGASQGGAAAPEEGTDGHGGRLDAVLKALMAELPLKQAAHLAAQITQARGNESYKRALYLKGLTA